MVLTTVEETQAPEAARYLLARTQQQIVDPEASRPIIEMIATIMVYKFTNLSRQEVDAMLGLQLADTRVYREAKEEGRLEGESALILRLLQRRFGAVDGVLASRIQALEIEQLEALAEALLDFTASFWANAVRPYIVDKIRYCRGAKLAPSDRLGYYSHASPLTKLSQT